MTAYVVSLRDSTRRDVPGLPRRLADEIEAGDYGQPAGCVVVLDADRLTVSYMGDGEAGPRAHSLLCAGAATLVRGVVEVPT